MGWIEDQVLHRASKTGSGGCMNWMTRSGRAWSGYATVCLDGKTVTVNRLLWESTNGPIPKGMVVMHSCDNPPCVNLGHLSIGTHADNASDRVTRNRGRGATGPRYYKTKHPWFQWKMAKGASK